MLKKLLIVLAFLMTGVAFAQNVEPQFVVLPNMPMQRLQSIDVNQVMLIQNKIIDIVKEALNVKGNNVYKTLRIRIIYNHENDISALVVYLLSAKVKSTDIVRINLTKDMTVQNVDYNYHLTLKDYDDSQQDLGDKNPTCPDDKVQFVIANNFDGDSSVEREVQKTYQAAKARGYNPYLMDINNASGPQPTVAAYKNWLSCPNVKGFYNESHGWNQGIVLSDGDFTYADLAVLKNKLTQNVILFDSCETFRDPLLSAVTDRSKGNAQQYTAGYISLPFGSSERAATCIWQHAFDQAELNQAMVNQCSRQSGLQENGYRIKGNGDAHIRPVA